MKNKLSFLLFAVMGLGLLFTSCTKKEDKPNQTFYGKLVLAAAQTSDTTVLEVRYQDKVIGNTPLNYPGVLLEAGVPGNLSVYIKGTNQKIADTTITLKRDEISAFKVAYMPELSLTGWLNTVTAPEDSLSIQFLNNLGVFYKAYSTYDLCIYYYDYNTGTLEDYNKTINDFQKVKLTTAILLPYYWGDKTLGQFNIFVGKLKDRATGQFITMPASGQDWFLLEQNYGGANYIYNIHDTDGEVSMNTINL